jgi:hypothetical protein
MRCLRRTRTIVGAGITLPRGHRVVAARARGHPPGRAEPDTSQSRGNLGARSSGTVRPLGKRLRSTERWLPFGWDPAPRNRPARRLHGTPEWRTTAQQPASTSALRHRPRTSLGAPQLANAVIAITVPACRNHGDGPQQRSCPGCCERNRGRRLGSAVFAVPCAMRLQVSNSVSPLAELREKNALWLLWTQTHAQHVRTRIYLVSYAVVRRLPEPRPTDRGTYAEPFFVVAWLKSAVWSVAGARGRCRYR